MAGPPVRERYNSKARGSTAGGGSHKKRKRPSKAAVAAAINEDGEGEEQEARRQEEPRAKLPMEGEGRGAMSAKKRKRMDSYIDKKLKNESRHETLKLLASLAPSAASSNNLLSSSSLGQNPLNPVSARERDEKREDKLVRRGIELLEKRNGPLGDEGSGSDSDDDEAAGHGRSGKGKGRAVETVHEAGVGEGQGHGGESKVQAKRRRKASKKADWNPNLLKTQPSDSSDFDSSDSENDSSVDEADAKPKDVRPDSHKAQAASAPVATEDGNSGTVKAIATEVPTPRPVSAFGSALSRGPTVAGSALRKAADGSTQGPRVVVRRKKVVQEESEDEDEDEDEDGDDDEDEEGSEEKSEGEEEDDADGDDGSGSGDEEEDGSDEQDGEDRFEGTESGKKRAFGFKAWALAQMGQDTAPSAPDLLETHTSATAAVPAADATTAPNGPLSKPKAAGPAIGPMGGTFSVPTDNLLAQAQRKVPEGEGKSARPTITRRPSVSESRMDLPIMAEEQAIIEAIRLNSAVVICGETGSGKTTQVPQMLYEAGFGFAGSENPGMIAVTQPRRVAAVSLATRVRFELNLPARSGVVAHQIRYSSTTSPDTAIKFMTDGVLLRELSADFLLSRYSVVVVDEAHERGVNTDVLIGVLSRVSRLREKKWRAEPEGPIKPLRIVIMSATLRLADFTDNKTLFPTPPPTIHVPARQHPVTIHFARKTTPDYVNEAYKKVCKIHARLPPGGVLVFMTGQNEIQGLVKRLEAKYTKKTGSGQGRDQGGRGARYPPYNGAKGKETEEVTAAVKGDLPPEDAEAEDVELGQDNDLAADIDDGDMDAVSDPEALDTDDEGDELDIIDEASDAPIHVLPLYSLLSHDAQLRIFQPPPEGHRLVIISTNVAETSLTIPGIRYVVDCGRAKERTYDPSTGVQSFQVQWIAKASANQRAGRAGRTGPGHCYRLYSSALFEDHFEAFSPPEISRMPIEGVVLQMKSMGIEQVVNFPFPTPPDRYTLGKAEELLRHLGALSLPGSTGGGAITDLGRQMSQYPVSPRFAKMLAIGNQHGCLPYVIAIVAGLSVGDPFIHESAIEADEEEGDKSGDELSYIDSEKVREKEERKRARKRYFASQAQFQALGGGMSDVFKLLSAVGAFEYDPTAGFCAKNFLRLKAMQEIELLRKQITGIAGVGDAKQANGKGGLGKLSPPSDTQLKVIRQILTSAFIDQLAIREDVYQKKNSTFTSCRSVPYRISSTSLTSGPTITSPEEAYVYIHPSSALFHRPPPEWLVYTELHRTGTGTGKQWMKGVTKINASWLWTLARGMCSLSRPVEMPGQPRGVHDRTKGDEREVVCVPHLRSMGVDLPPTKVKQKREGSRWVLVE